MLDPFAATNAFHNPRFFIDTFRRHEHRHRAADRLLGGVTEQSLAPRFQVMMTLSSPC